MGKTDPTFKIMAMTVKLRLKSSGHLNFEKPKKHGIALVSQLQ